MEWSSAQNLYGSLRTWARKSFVSMQGWENFQVRLISDEVSDSEIVDQLSLGIPDEMRAQIWPSVLFTRTEGWVKEFGLFEDLLQSSDHKDEIQIRKDLSRILLKKPEGVRIEELDVQEKLSDVLRAYVYANPQTGYFQGMGYIALLLIKEIGDPENAFWMFKLIMENFNFMTLYEDINCMLYYHYICLRSHLPKLSKHLLENGVRPSMYAQSWYLSAFVRDLPYEYVLRVWDLLILKGKTFLLQVGIALIQLKADLLLSMHDTGDLMITLADFDNIPPADELIETALSIKISDKQMIILNSNFDDYMNKHHEAYLDDDLQEFQIRRNRQSVLKQQTAH